MTRKVGQDHRTRPAHSDGTSLYPGSSSTPPISYSIILYRCESKGGDSSPAISKFSHGQPTAR